MRRVERKERRDFVVDFVGEQERENQGKFE